ncbi:MAG: phosphoribosylformylglycinamidine synthase subunit PurQ [Pseudomonadota bacterium]
MKAAVVVFPGSNCDRDLAVALRRAGFEVQMLWHKETSVLAGLDLIGLPGGFSHGDYLRCGAIAARAPVMRAVSAFARAGGHVIGICNGFQVLIETGLLPGALMRNAGLKFVCKTVHLRVESTDSPFTAGYGNAALVQMPVAHHDGNYTADAETLAALKDTGRIAFRYCTETGAVADTANPNGSADAIAGILSENRRVLGLMPHPERAADPALGLTDGQTLFAGLVARAVPA